MGENFEASKAAQYEEVAFQPENFSVENYTKRGLSPEIADQFAEKAESLFELMNGTSDTERLQGN